MPPLHAIAVFTVPTLWAIWAAIWIVRAFGNKRTVHRQAAYHYIPFVLIAVCGGLVIQFISHPFTRFFPISAAGDAIGVGLVAAGLGWSIWARIVLGANWSGIVTLKHDHELIQSGPYPLTARLSVTDWSEGVTVEESIELVRRLKADGLDLLDVSHGFSTPDISKIPWGPGFMIPVASRIRRETGVPTAVGWMITDPHQADQAVLDQHTDIVLLGRELLRDPYWPYHAAQTLGLEKAPEILPIQYARAVKR